MRIIIPILLLFMLSCSKPQSDAPRETWDTTGTGSAGSQVFDNNNIKESQPQALPGDRQYWQNPDLVLDKLGNLENKTVADIGAGTGYFTFRLAERGANVIAVDIDPDYLTYISDRRDQLSSSRQQQIETRLSEPDSPPLEPNEADFVLLVNTYTFLPDRVEYLKKVYAGLTENGSICIVDYKNDEVPVISDETPVLNPTVVRNDLTKAGFQKIQLDSVSLEYQYIFTAKK
ncbi:class I SAM-dependent methyltransferase [Fulvivirga sedimenti]|uniref:Methyltransferase domain-containing protein n=1 Tax=Fulvivirga sedimenti TaxID=2879465 RepID=A0A9X1HXC7_9BACT|nr:methyltransferase domain-containing protein [Fulvivirga sedimenti]MCA6078187.1 methyltransferase domain-containing protein [Fulvivirga sedimenti]